MITVHNLEYDYFVSHAKPDNLIDYNGKGIDSTYEYIKKIDRNKLPHSIGLFGGWGSGKTTYLAYLAKKIERENPKQDIKMHVIYYNAWKYAGFMEIVSTLFYKILKKIEFLIENQKKNEQKDYKKSILKVMTSLGQSYFEELSKGIEKKTAISPTNLYIKTKEALNINHNENEIEINKLLDLYYSQIDEAQVSFKNVIDTQLKKNERIVVIIDELDRCDPGEAFDVIKQLRIFFSIQDIPIIFILSLNPEPIGLAINHKYGLNNGHYDENKILEKYIDTYIDLSEPHSLEKYIKMLWQTKESSNSTCLIESLDNQLNILDEFKNRFSCITLLESITTNNIYYNNLRILEKSIKSIAQEGCNFNYT